MGAYTYQVGLGNVSAYAIAPRPFLTSSNIYPFNPNGGEVRIDFPNVSKFINVVNKGSTPIYIHFDTRANADVYNHGHYVKLSSLDDSYSFSVRSVFVYISQDTTTLTTGSFQLHSELTSIAREEMHILSGSGINS